MTDRLVSFWNRPVSGYRTLFATRLLLLTFAADLCINAVPYAARYGVGNFDVPHFGFGPLMLPSEVHLTASIVMAVLAIDAAFRRPSCGSMMALFVLHTGSWSASMLDSYQHHYFLSLCLLCLALSTRRSARAPLRPIGWRMLGITCAALYLFTAMNKLEPGWRDGQVVAGLLAREMGLVREGLAVSDETVRLIFQAATWGTIAMEAFIAAAYLVVATVGTSGRVRWLGWVAVTLAAFLHVGIELAGVRIGFFTIYMLALAAGFFLPRRALARLQALMDGPKSCVQAWWRRPERHSADTRADLLTFSAILLALAFLGIRLPGTSFAVVAAVVATTIWRSVKGRPQSLQRSSGGREHGEGPPADRTTGELVSHGRRLVLSLAIVVFAIRVSGARERYLTRRVANLTDVGEVQKAEALRGKFISKKGSDEHAGTH